MRGKTSEPSGQRGRGMWAPRRLSVALCAGLAHPVRRPRAPAREARRSGRLRLGQVRVAVEGVARGKTLLDDGSKAWGSDNPWTGRPVVRVALGLQAEPVLQEITARLSK